MPIAATAQAFGAAGQKSAPNTLPRRLLRLLAGSHAVSLADQAVVSAASFLALILIGRWGGASQLGAYAIGASVLALLIAAQEALVTRPYAIHLHRPAGSPGEHAWSALLLAVLVSALAAAGLAAIALLLWASSADPGLVTLCAALAAIAPSVLLREFARRFAFAHLRTGDALAMDAAVAALNIAVLGSLGWTGRLSAASAFAATGVSCAVALAGWFWLSRARFTPGFDRFGQALKQSWAMGKWLLSGQIALQAQGYTTHWLSWAIAGAAATGVYAASVSIVAFANPVLFGIFNILTPRSVRALRDGGGAGLRRQAARDALLLGAAMSLFSGAVFLIGGELMRLLFPALDYPGAGHILTVLALATLASAVGVPASAALASADRARAVAAVMAGTALFNVAIVWALIVPFGLLGAAYGVLAAEIVGSLARWAAFLALVPAAGTAAWPTAGAAAPPLAAAAAERLG